MNPMYLETTLSWRTCNTIRINISVLEKLEWLLLRKVRRVPFTPQHGSKFICNITPTCSELNTGVFGLWYHFCYERDVTRKLAQFQVVCATIERTLQWKRLKETQLRSLAVPTLLQGAETWMFKMRDLSKIKISKMTFWERYRLKSRGPY